MKSIEAQARHLQSMIPVASGARYLMSFYTEHERRRRSLSEGVAERRGHAYNKFLIVTT